MKMFYRLERSAAWVTEEDDSKPPYLLTFAETGLASYCRTLVIMLFGLPMFVQKTR